MEHGGDGTEMGQSDIEIRRLHGTCGETRDPFKPDR